VSRDVLVVVPAFNEAGTVARVVADARRHAPVLVVDDGSTDGTGEIARAAGATVLRHERRCGKGAALATALTAARRSGVARVVTLDADGQHDPGDIPALLTASDADPRAIVVGRRLGDDDGAIPCGRALANRVAGFWVNWVAGTAVTDTQSGFRVYPLALFDETGLRGGRFVFETAVLVDAVRRGWRVREVPIRAVACAARASRFHPVTDGVAIAAFLSGHAVARWGVELAEGVREVFRLFARDRRLARHGRMLAKASLHAGMPSWGPALGVAFIDEVQSRTTRWWNAPRARRARRAALATAAAPALLLVTGVAGLTGAPGLALVDRMVRTLYDQRLLPPLTTEARDERREDRAAWAAAPR
jgi:hypothetical protein